MFTDNQTPFAFYDEATRELAAQFVVSASRKIVDDFYRELTSNPKTAEYLDHEEVESRLKGSMGHWLMYTFDHKAITADPEAFHAFQKKIGRVHSRAGINLSMVNYAKILLKRAVVGAIPHGEFSNNLFCYLSEVIDYSIDGFNVSYLSEVVETTRHQQSLQIHSSGHHLAFDLERAKNGVNVWIKNQLWNLSGTAQREEVRVEDLSIYHWLKHKGSFSFTDADSGQKLLASLDELKSIERLIQAGLEHGATTSDLELTQSVEAAMALTDAIVRQMDEIIEGIFKEEQKKDALTRTLSRRYLSAVAQREVIFARQQKTPFSLMMIDIDDFKAINDNYGHRTGDLVLERVAATLLERVRPGDYVFRYGGEEFLIILSETGVENAADVAEEIRRLVADLELADSGAESIHLSISIGVAEYDFHPDFMRTVEKADQRLYQAKHSGKNRVVVSD